MPSDYNSIHSEHRLDYGRKLTVWAQDHLANRYADRTHFIFELLQNGEDALQERGESALPTSITFNLLPTGLEVRHFGKPFTPDNVKSICAINESTKKDELTEIGRFGIGFKSVYAFTRRPEVHSGDEHFAIEEFVLPVAVAPRQVANGETLFWIPFLHGDQTAVPEISLALQSLGARRLLFLKGINEILWSLPDGTKGLFMKNAPVPDQNGELITLLGEVQGRPKKQEENWLLFRRAVKGPNDRPAGFVAIAFMLQRDGAGQQAIREVPDARLIVFFPTDVPTGTGFLIQGPYRTTPSRDNVPASDPWNRQLIDITAELLVTSLRFLRDGGLLTVDALKVLPIDSRLFGNESMFLPLFERTRDALKLEPLLPTIAGDHVAGIHSRLARGEGIRELFAPDQLAQLLGVKPNLFWLSDEITKDRAGGLREYLLQHVGVGEITPDYLQSRLNVAFLTVQTDEWMRRFYEFLQGQKAVLREILRRSVEFIRCEDNTHVQPIIAHQPQVFLPSEGITGFRTVKRGVCTPAVVEFLTQLGLSSPDPVDDVVQNVLNVYQERTVSRTNSEYASDLRRILAAFQTDSDQGRRKLLEALKSSYFVRAMEAQSGIMRLARASETYRATQRLKTVFAGVAGVWLVDDSYSALKGESMRELLQACGALDVIRTVPCGGSMTWEEKKQVRLREGNQAYTYDVVQNDTDCPELQGLLDTISELPVNDVRERSLELWLLLRDTLHDRREAYFQATYRWSYSHTYSSAVIPATWVRRLQRSRWIADSTGAIRAPHEISFSDAEAEIQSAANPFLAEILEFRPETIKQLAEKEGIDLEVLNLLKRHNISAAQLRDLIAAEDENHVIEETEEIKISPAEREGDDSNLTNEPEPPDEERSQNGNEDLETATAEEGRGFAGTSRGGGSPGRSRESFQTYVGVLTDNDSDSDEKLPDHERLEIEQAAISFILEHEPSLERTPTNNPGFDLFEGESLEFVVRFVEVKSKKGEWSGVVALSEEQFRLAETERERFWLYVVEFAQDAAKRRLHRVQDPVGKARYFTFDRGWKELAERQ